MEEKNNLENNLLQETSRIVSSYSSNNKLDKKELLDLISDVYKKLQQLVSHQGIDINETIHKDYLICLEDNVKTKLLGKYLKTKYNMTPQEYCEKWNLPSNYPMVAPGYSNKRSAIAKKTGFGKK